MEIKLSEQQAAGLDKVINWYEDRRFHTIPGSAFGADVFTWFGYAGTGKTFTAARIPEALGIERVVFGTYTGKAASVLRRSLNRYGVDYPVSTIHSAIYFPTTSKAARDALDEVRREIAELEEMESSEDEDTVPKLKARITELKAKLPKLEADANRLRWEWNPESDWAYADLIVLDEVSMVNAKLAADIEAYGVPILVLGDPAQLPPVEGGGYYTDREPAVLLTDIQRAALDSPVTELATRVRQSQGSGLGMRPGDMRARSLKEAMEADMVLVWTNKRRWSMIQAIRNRLDRPAGQPVPGDVIMNLANSKDMAVFNGQMFTVLDAKRSQLGWDMTVRDEEGNERPLYAYPDGFIGQDEQTRAKNTGLGVRGERALCTFAQAITVHKAQGSEAEKVYVVNETPGMIAMTAKREGERAALEQARRWIYTAVTRAREQVIITRPQ